MPNVFVDGSHTPPESLLHCASCATFIFYSRRGFPLFQSSLDQHQLHTSFVFPKCLQLELYIVSQTLVLIFHFLCWNGFIWPFHPLIKWLIYEMVWLSCCRCIIFSPSFSPSSSCCTVLTFMQCLKLLLFIELLCQGNLSFLRSWNTTVTDISILLS